MRGRLLVKNRYQSAVPSQEASGKLKSFFRKDSTQAVLMLLPMLIGFFTFTYFPILYIVRFAFTDSNGFSHNFVGLDNFVRIFTRDTAFWQSIINTLILTGGKLIIEIPLALFLAVLLTKAIKWTHLFRVILFLPSIVSTAIVGLIFTLMFAAFRGVVNTMLINIGLLSMPVDWFATRWTALFVIGAASIWTFLGVNIVFFMMALQGIPKEVYECADLDGATGIKKFIFVTLPMIGPVFRVVLLNAIIGSLQVADLVLSSTNGGPNGQTEVVMTYVFKHFFGLDGRRMEVGYASAMSTVTAIILGIITYIYLKSSKKMAET